MGSYAFIGRPLPKAVEEIWKDHYECVYYREQNFQTIFSYVYDYTARMRKQNQMSLLTMPTGKIEIVAEGVHVHGRWANVFHSNTSLICSGYHDNVVRKLENAQRHYSESDKYIR